MLDLSRLRTYKVAELESIAREKLRELYPNYSIPVDIELLVEKMPHVDLDIYPALSANHKMLGMVGVDLDTGQLVIYIDDKLADEERLRRRYRMTVAEELAHIVLHYDVIAMAERPEDFVELQQHKRWDECERNAKRLAAALLMPHKDVLERSRLLFTQIMSMSSVRTPLVIENVLAGKLADAFDVSASSMGYRLREWPIKVNDKIRTAIRDKLDFLE